VTNTDDEVVTHVAELLGNECKWYGSTIIPIHHLAKVQNKQV